MAEENISKTLTKIEAGAYRIAPNRHLPPAPPEILRRSAASMSDEELDEMLAARTAFKEEQQLYEMAADEHKKLKQNLINQLQNDLEEEYGVKPGPLADKLFYLCGKYANGNLISLFGFYDDLQQLLKPVADEIETKPVEVVKSSKDKSAAAA